jgi:hypothetical protein
MAQVSEEEARDFFAEVDVGNDSAGPRRWGRAGARGTACVRGN